MFSADDLKKRVGKRIKLVLRNGNYYVGDVQNVGDGTFFIVDKNGDNVEISCDEVAEIVEVDY